MNRAGHKNLWTDFWGFVSDVGDKPGDKYRLRRRDENKPFGPENWYWAEPILGSDGDWNRERHNAYMRAWFAKNPAKKKEYDLKKHYGISIDEYESILSSQGGGCAICGQKDEFFNLAVDHCHGTNRIRGLLCSLCNRGIGMFRDSPELLAKAIDYLKFPKFLI